MRHTAETWRMLATHARTIASTMEDDPPSQQTMLEIAAGYDRLAWYADRRSQAAVQPPAEAPSHASDPTGA